ncbi:glycoside hydrolase family 127 protein [Bifidobacterium cebidarum]|uniref:Beta-L-arabinofuranosidase n=1 Tax=Bifidobacterium cebidarum TaxID=2650773 RepID=A0A6I1GMD4_9BIFI|nr:beta-L-arabinofuranosidase domain-containing protein [Bifidobacterium cebidarum]KAB7786785.1 Beta-L-arabinofuranosidase [Bifidobacterium cebidarum]
MTGKASKSAHIAGTRKPAEPQVSITSKFWGRYRSMTVNNALPYQWRALNDEVPVDVPDGTAWGENGSQFSHSMRNLRIAAGREPGSFSGQPFQDTDVSKWLEAASYALGFAGENPDINIDELEQQVNEVVDLFADAQDKDGYIDTKFEIDLPADQRFRGLRWSHELYTMGHLIEAAVANWESTGSTKALNVARRAASCIDQHFGDGEGKVHGPDGHPEIELALARLYKATGERRWLDLAAWFIRVRGMDPEFFDEQDHAGGPQFYKDLHMPLSYFIMQKPVLDLDKAEGHAVRLLYMATAIAEVGQLLDDARMLAAAERLWTNIVRHRMYVTGNVGSCQIGESFSYDDDLPNDLGYGETCASVAMLFFGKALMETHPTGAVADVMELELFNGMLAGIQLDGTRYFYVNPLEADPAASNGNPTKAHVLTRRAGWFDCACCPANIVRLIASLDRYLYTVKGNTIYAHQYIANKTDFGNGLVIEQSQPGEGYPWSGDIEFQISNPEGLQRSLAVRIPAWSAKWTLDIDGRRTYVQPRDGFIAIDVSKPETHIKLVLDMSVRCLRASLNVKADAGKLAVARGPIVYCMEEVDNPHDLWTYSMPVNAQVSEHYDAKLLDGVEVLKFGGVRDVQENTGLYIAVDKPVERRAAELTMIPYYAWCNRTEGQMQVWVRETVR